MRHYSLEHRASNNDSRRTRQSSSKLAYTQTGFVHKIRLKSALSQLCLQRKHGRSSIVDQSGKNTRLDLVRGRTMSNANVNRHLFTFCHLSASARPRHGGCVVGCNPPCHNRNGNIAIASATGSRNLRHINYPSSYPMVPYIPSKILNHRDKTPQKLRHQHDFDAPDINLGS